MRISKSDFEAIVAQAQYVHPEDNCYFVTKAEGGFRANIYETYLGREEYANTGVTSVHDTLFEAIDAVWYQYAIDALGAEF